ncbi:MAG: DEAD/DEAH box helicase [Magnetococcales bacterium]|nr:DEAD/DEAH box helicase [Magnetococcales bacterium]MBF0116723.1 DEAD/DEAH box helicase [Magnetococcales bacterium]
MKGTYAGLTPQMAEESYALLSPSAQAILQFLSVLMESINRTNLARHVRSAAIQGEDGRAMNGEGLNTILDRLAGLELIVSENQPGNRFYCAAVIAAHATRCAASSGRLTQFSAVIQKEFPLYQQYANKVVSYARCLREVRTAVYLHDPERVAKYIQICLEQCREQTMVYRPYVQICDYPFAVDWFRSLPPSIQVDALQELVASRLENFATVADLLPLLHALRNHPDASLAAKARKQLVTVLLFQGQLDAAQEILQADQPIEHAFALQGWLHFVRGQNDQAVLAFERLMGVVKKVNDRRWLMLGEWSGLFLLLALLKSSAPQHRTWLVDFLAQSAKKPITFLKPVCVCLDAALAVQQNKISHAESLLTSGVDWTPDWINPEEIRLRQLVRSTQLTKLFRAIVGYWIDREQARKHKSDLQELCDQAKRHGHHWPLMECAALMSALEPTAPEVANLAATLCQTTGLHSLLPIVALEEPWERALTSLVQMGGSEEEQGQSTGNKRLVWLIQVVNENMHIIQAREQQLSARGVWTKGRVFSMRRLYQNDPGLHYLTEQDWRICDIVANTGSYFSGYFYDSSWHKIMLAMVGHPLVFWATDPDTNVEVVRAEPELLVEEKKDHVTIRFAEPVEKEGVLAIQESPTRCKLVEVTAAHKKIADILGKNGLRVPVDAKARVLHAMRAVSSLVTIHSGIGGSVDNMAEIAADATPHLHLLPHGNGLKVNLRVRPFAGDGPYFQPGKGGGTIIAEVAGQRVQTKRNLREERQRASALVLACAVLSAEEEQNEWLLDDPEQCLELLVNLQTVIDQVVVEWPEGEKMRVGRPVAMDNLRVQIQREQEWFAVTGAVQVDESQVLEMTQLLDLVRGRESRFVPMGDGTFLALTTAFRKQLAELDTFSEQHAQGRRFHPLAGTLFRELFTGAGAVGSDRYWKAHLTKIDRAQTLDPALPTTLQAELRDYQVTGFCWLARLAAWGVGACLADDMGLGKTLQTLALLLYRAQEGPSLVVAPISVGLNWLAEMDRFAPTLRGIVFGAGQRQQTLESLKPFEVVICSYGLLQQEAEMLAKVRWNVIVLDEAQAIKNRLTKRSQAAMALQGSFRMATTGTPMENHLGELWNLYQFLNPGLLGTLEQFNERFAVPIERQGDKGAQKRLRKLIQPFLLRRTKNQVLDELPSRTEIVLHVALSQEEMAFYETLRRKAIENIENLDGPAEQKRFQILAELMRLRRACCNSRLVLPDSPIESSKLAVFWEVVEELLENRHKALVFSQFVDHLSILRALLDEKRIAYQYLDGSTPAKERKRRVDAFQAGEGDLFLISLKAGGMGINLTAADYVIHMDPWWNPAVEDQASDRAHRIGQLRPVTIYRLVSKETIEEKIVDLHRHKRDLADGLLEGGEMSGKLSVDDLLNMIRGRE